MNKAIDFQQIIENEPFITMRLSFQDGVWKIWYVSQNVKQYGFDPSDLMNGTISWDAMIHPDDRVVAIKQANDYMRKSVDDFQLQYRILTEKGESTHIIEYSHVNRDSFGNVLCVDSVLLNTTTVEVDRNIAINHFKQQAVMNDILLSLHDANLELSLQIILERVGRYLNTSRVLLFKDSPDHKTCKVVCEWLNKHITSIKDLDYAVTYETEMPEIYVALQNTGFLLVNAGEIPENCKEEFENEGLVSSAIFAVYLHGEHYGFVCFDDCVVQRVWDEDTANFLKNISNMISNVLFRIHTEEKLEHHEEEIRKMAFTDYLTGLPNRFRCGSDLIETLKNSKKTGQGGYVFFIDLDDFKIVNDCYGHDFGDGVLVSFANYAKELFAENATVYRFGGDEFVIILNTNDDTLAYSYLNNLLKRAKKPWTAMDKEFYCSLSIGVVKFAAHGDDSQSIIKKADIAMYQAKKAGKNNFVFYTEGLASDSIKRSEMEALLRNAIENDCQGFIIYYQPYVNTQTRKIIGAEALVRMVDAKGGLILPEQFLPLAEYLGLIVPLGDWILGQAAKQCHIINSIKGLEDFTIIANMSPKQFKQKDIVLRTENILKKSEVNFNNIVISMNENMAVNAIEKMLQVCAELQKKNIKVELNDFGSGSSSFINMRDLPIDAIQVSSNYIENIEDQFTNAFLKLVTNLGHSTGKLILMSGIETESQYDFCKEIGIDIVQGFALYSPTTAENLIATLTDKEQSN